MVERTNTHGSIPPCTATFDMFDLLTGDTPNETGRGAGISSEAQSSASGGPGEDANSQAGVAVDAFGSAALPLEKVSLADIVPCRWLQRVRDVGDEVAALRRSIEQIGMIHDPVGRRVEIDGVSRVECLSGHRRVDAARAEGHEWTWMRVLALDDAQAFRVLIDGNLRAGSGSAWEDARYIQLWRRLFAPEGEEFATQAGAAEFFGYSEPKVSLSVKLLTSITPDVWEAARVTEEQLAQLGWKALTTIAAVRRFEDRAERLRQAVVRLDGANPRPRRARQPKPPIILRESATGRVVLEVDFRALDDPDVAREALQVTLALERRVQEHLREPA